MTLVRPARPADILFSHLETPALNQPETAERLSPSARKGYVEIAKAWSLKESEAARLIGLDVTGWPEFSRPGNTEPLPVPTLQRIGLVGGIHRGLHTILPNHLADQWPKRPNDNALFDGHTPLDTMLRFGIGGIVEVRDLVDTTGPQLRDLPRTTKPAGRELR